VMAVLETRCGMVVAGNDVYLSVAGGLRVAEPAADMAVAAALASSASGVPVPSDTVIFGEIGLSGEVRAVSQTDSRLREAEKLGFTQAIIPKRRGKTKRGVTALKIREIDHLSELLDIFHPKETKTTSYVANKEQARHG
ncbi:MAG: magnesium chelatase domain-containing protein, partial [Rhodospirillales bacterium]